VEFFPGALPSVAVASKKTKDASEKIDGVLIEISPLL